MKAIKSLKDKINPGGYPGLTLGLVIAGIFLVAGFYFLLSSRASGLFVALETENGTLSSGATAGSDSTASGGSYVKFGGTTTATQTQLVSLIQNVTGAKGSRYGAHDSAGNTMDTAKIIANPAGGYLAVYHTVTAVKVSTSTDLLNWTYKTTLDPSATQPTIMATSDGGFVVAEEYNNGTGGGGQVRVRHYASLSALLSATADKTYTATRTLSQCNEGTPSIYSVTLNPDISHSVIDLGMHYHDNCDVDRQARATLTNFTTWSAQTQPALDSALIAAAQAAGQTVGGNIGDRDTLTYGGVQYNIHEVQYVKGDFGSWRPYLYNFSTGKALLLKPVTKGGSTAFANPTFTLLKDPAGTPSIVVTLFVPTQGAATGETGELIYYAPLP